MQVFAKMYAFFVLFVAAASALQLPLIKFKTKQSEAAMALIESKQYVTDPLGPLAHPLVTDSKMTLHEINSNPEETRSPSNCYIVNTPKTWQTLPSEPWCNQIPCEREDYANKCFFSVFNNGQVVGDNWEHPPLLPYHAHTRVTKKGVGLSCASEGYDAFFWNDPNYNFWVAGYIPQPPASVHPDPTDPADAMIYWMLEGVPGYQSYGCGQWPRLIKGWMYHLLGQWGWRGSTCLPRCNATCIAGTLVSYLNAYFKAVRCTCSAFQDWPAYWACTLGTTNMINRTMDVYMSDGIQNSVSFLETGMSKEKSKEDMNRFSSRMKSLVGSIKEIKETHKGKNLGEALMEMLQLHKYDS